MISKTEKTEINKKKSAYIVFYKILKKMFVEFSIFVTSDNKEIIHKI